MGGRRQAGRRRRRSQTSMALSPRKSTRSASRSPGWRRGELGVRTQPCPPAVRALGRAGPCKAPLPSRQVPYIFLLQLSPPASPSAASQLPVSLLLPCPRSLQSIVRRSWHVLPMSFPSERSRPGVCDVFFCPSKFSGFITSSSRKIHRLERAII